MDRNRQSGSSGYHNVGFTSHPHQQTKTSFRQSDFDSNTNAGGFVIPGTASGDVNQITTSVAHPHSSVINVADDTSAWRCSRIQELNPEEHGDYFEPNAEKIYREKVRICYL